MSSPVSPLRVLHLDHTTEHGGAELALQRLLLDPNRGWDATLAIPFGAPIGVFEGVEVAGVDIERIGPEQPPGATKAGLGGAARIAWSLLLQARDLRRSPSFRTADIVHANSTRSAVYGALAVLGTRKPLVVHLRDRIEPAALGTFGFQAFRHLVARAATSYIANSEATAATISGVGRRSAPLTVIPSPTGVPRQTALDSTHENRRLRIGMIARLDDWKGQDLLIEAFAAAGLDDDADLVFYGDAAFGKEDYSARLRHLVSIHRLRSTQFAGFADDVQAAIDGLDVCVQYSTRPEPLGQNVLQYLARAKVVIVAAEGGPREWVKDGVNGLLAEPRNAGALADLLKRVVTDPGLRRALRQGALRTPDLPTDASVTAAHLDVFRVEDARRHHDTVNVLAWPRDSNRTENPYTQLLYRKLEEVGVRSDEFSIRKALFGAHDILHVHWPEGIIGGRAPRPLIAAAAQRALIWWERVIRRKKIVWTVHNLRPHAVSNPRALALVQSTLRRHTDGLIFLSHASRDAAHQVYPWMSSRPSTVTLHGRYRGAYSLLRDAAAVREELGIPTETRIVAFLGRIEPYKALDTLAKAMIDLADSGVSLLVAGRLPDSAYGAHVRDLIEHAGGILEEGWVEDDRLAELAAASDLVVFPYKSILNSGSILLPLEFDTPVLAPALGSIPEMADVVGRKWLRTFEGPISSGSLQAALLDLPVRGTHPDLSALEWEPIAHDTAKLYRSL